MFKANRYIFGKDDQDFNNPPPRAEVELHGYSDGGTNGFGIVIFVRWRDNHGHYRMKRLFAASRVVSSKSTMSVPRRELNGIVMAVKKLLELEAPLEIPHENTFLHTDSIVCLYWVKRNQIN